MQQNYMVSTTSLNAVQASFFSDTRTRGRIDVSDNNIACNWKQNRKACFPRVSKLLGLRVSLNYQLVCYWHVNGHTT